MGALAVYSPCMPLFLWTGGSGHSNTTVFSLGQSVGLMSDCVLLFVALGS